MASKRSKKNPAGDGMPSLFDTADETPKIAARADPAKSAEREMDPPGILLGTSAFTADGWAGSFYPAGLRPADYLSYYATRFRTVELDSTFYRTPPAATMRGWYAKTPPDFIFAAKVPRTITHEKVLVDCDEDWRQFLATMEISARSWGQSYFNSDISIRARFVARTNFWRGSVHS